MDRFSHLERGDPILTNVSVAREAPNTGHKAYVQTETDRNIIESTFIEASDRADGFGLEVRVEYDGLYQWVDPEAVIGVEKCDCGSEKVHHDKKEEWICPFCDL